MMMDEWRREWHAGTGGGTDPNFPIGFVQIGPLGGTAGPVNASREHDDHHAAAFPTMCR
jgi:hypothetical protein